MPEIELHRLRKLRRRTEILQGTLVPDLIPFRHKNHENGFIRKPDSNSDSGDVNVTTTCSCLMALALTDKLSDFYPDSENVTANEIFQKLLEAPWMSSGLAENNAFTTALVIRTFGFLNETQALKETPKPKPWEARLNFSDFRSFAVKLVAKQDHLSRFLFGLMSKDVQKAVDAFVSSGENLERVQKDVTNELGRIIRTTALPSRLKGVSLSLATISARVPNPDAYATARFNRLLLDDYYPEISPLKERSLTSIAWQLSEDDTYFSINAYESAAAVIYWFVDGVDRAKIRLPVSNWNTLCRWATKEFGRQRSLVVAKHAAMMDPVAMAMAACLCARLRSISNRAKLGTTNSHQTLLPSIVELEQAVIELFQEQTSSGIWPKYFPLFHYQEAGSNFCFTFELLEAVLKEFGDEHNSLIGRVSFIEGLERAITWCEQNRLQCSESREGNLTHFTGWNSGGFFETLRKGQPESWATAVVHMFLWELVDVLSRHIQQRLLQSYSARRATSKWKDLRRLLDIDLLLDGRHSSLKRTLADTIVKTFRSFKGKQAERLRRMGGKKSPLSALLFGPPGTSKTEVAKAVAKQLDWPLVEIDPSHFLQDGFQNIYVQAERIFEDVMDMCGVVVLFDEMDALVQKRDADTSLDTESKFLTTYMLPKLAKLHDRGQLVFLMATNFQASFDDAIKRAGRFDFLLCMGPPTLQAKCDSIHDFFEADSTEETKMAGRLIGEYAAQDPWVEDQLSLYTYGEFISFISEVGAVTEIGTRLEALGLAGFRSLVKSNSQSVSLRMSDLEKLRNVQQLAALRRTKDLDKSIFDEGQVTAAGVDAKLPVIKYMLDRKQTRRQYPKSHTKT